MRAISKTKTVRSIFYIVDRPPHASLIISLRELTKILGRAHRITKITRVERIDKMTDLTNKYL